jgi:hypothetical protein
MPERRVAAAIEREGGAGWWCVATSTELGFMACLGWGHNLGHGWQADGGRAAEEGRRRSKVRRVAEGIRRRRSWCARPAAH